MARAIRDHRLQVELTSIDPQPRAEIDRLCTAATKAPADAILTADNSVIRDLRREDLELLLP